MTNRLLPYFLYCQVLQNDIRNERLHITIEELSMSFAVYTRVHVIVINSASSRS